LIGGEGAARPDVADEHTRVAGILARGIAADAACAMVGLTFGIARAVGLEIPSYAGVMRAPCSGDAVVGALANAEAARAGGVAMVGRAGDAGSADAGAFAIAGGRLHERVRGTGARPALGPLGVELAAPVAVAETIASARGGKGRHAAGFGFGLSRGHREAAPFHAGQRATQARAVAGLFAAHAIQARAREALVRRGAGLAVLFLRKTRLVAGAIAADRANEVAARATGAAAGPAGIAAQAAARDDRPGHASPL